MGKDEQVAVSIEILVPVRAKTQKQTLVLKQPHEKQSRLV